uniref:Uncharacterized protein n=1 Tax=Setaria viridis TaxID=4556 RepID=A0A4V6D1B7_SETVI|nr:hypothetical protein SEVIR_9G268650v2 [Setaria viridis]
MILLVMVLFRVSPWFGFSCLPCDPPNIKSFLLEGNIA